jgi:hypothetical protein
MFKQGQKVEHILSGDWVLVLSQEEGKYLCRTKDLREVWFFDFELKPVKSVI